MRSGLFSPEVAATVGARVLADVASMRSGLFSPEVDYGPHGEVLELQLQ